jgi:NADH-quinone oxidoreductase subunit F
MGTNSKYVVRVGMASCGIAAGARKVFDALTVKLPALGTRIELKKTGCMGMCYNEPLVEVVSPVGQSTLYIRVTPESVERIINEHIIGGWPVNELAISHVEWDSLMGKQKRIVLRNCGVIDPENIDDYIAAGGYEALRKALTTMTPEDVINEVLKAGLRGRGGAGFPTDVKWSLARKAAGNPKYIVCNADEGDPGAFMNRNVLESDPHAVLEGMLIAGYTIGASTGFIYCRAEYPLAIERLELTLARARERGFLGDNIMGSGFDLDITIRQGAGAFVCGEETALMLSIEGKRGMRGRVRPFPPKPGCGASRPISTMWRRIR